MKIKWKNLTALQPYPATGYVITGEEMENPPPKKHNQ